MAAPFSRSMRALHAESPAWPHFGLTVATLLIIVWASWFFLADLTLRETGQLSHVTPSGAVVATFPAEVAGRLRNGQPAALRLQGVEHGSPLPAIVTRVGTPRDAQRLEVELYPKSRLTFTSLTRATSQNGDDTVMGQAAIEIARTTPATLLMRTLTASRQFSPAPRPSAR